MTAVDPFAVVRAHAPAPVDLDDPRLAEVRARFTQLTGVPVGDDAVVVVPLAPPRTRRPSRRHMLPAAVAAVVALLLGLAVVVTRDDGRRDDEVGTTAGPLAAVAALAAEATPVPADWGQQYLRAHVVERTTNVLAGVADPFPALVEADVERWAAPDGTWVDVAGPLTQTTLTSVPADLGPPLDTFSGAVAPGSRAGQLGAAELAALPTDAAALDTELQRLATADPDRPQPPVLVIAALLEQPAVAPAVRAALIDALARQPGVIQSTGEVDGRPVVVAAVDTDRGRVEVALDAGSGALVRTLVRDNDRADRPDAAPGDVLSSRTLDQSALVDERGDHP